MNRAYQFRVAVDFYHRPFHEEYFIDEKSAREYANRMYLREDTKCIELWKGAESQKRHSYGYRRVKAIVRHHEGAGAWISK